MNLTFNLARGLAILAIGTSVFAADMALAEKKDTPLNAGKNGIKSNAGGGNGTEGQVGETTSTTDTVVINNYTYDDVTTGEPVTVSVTTQTVEAGRVATDSRLVGCGSGKQCNVQTTYLVTYNVYTTVGTETTVTTQTMEVTETQKQTTTTTDMYDIDPGHSQPVNQAPEGEPEDVVVVEYADPVTTEEPVGDATTSVVSDSSTSVTGTSTAEVRETTPCNNDQCQ
ncbi:MAG: hypothetical protein ACD_54C00665G0002 [uncultured bacterium]|uniref:hypothetical protein n=1 Tax=Cypionkella sp. TaxID=2811411 RepID=UPI000285A6E1|nr:hypothetical protein [Cypionkella sp.]EKD60572.1 MAG: hypothetical protein ACD_54C00665G0002 [uncultured bacterium]KAF0172904.1 MAG: Uncharacterized protein FD162_2181 [Paracoccaceae bacterium]MDO8326173.1 hypothetical protein [Cypionkella sp.]